MTREAGPGDRYSLDGLISLYTFEPSLRDVYVEGRSDAGLVGWYLLQNGLANVGVFAVDDRVEIPASAVRELALDVNARGRAICLAQRCDQELGADQLGVTVIVDADFSNLAESRLSYACLLYTEQPAMECYALAEQPLEKLLRVTLRQPEDVTARQVRAAVDLALKDVFAVRFVLHEHAIGCIDDVAGVCRLEAGRSGADVKELIRRSLSKVKRQDRPAEVPELVEQASRARVRVDETGQVGRGHDIAPLLIAFLQLKGPAANRDALEMMMRSCLSREDLDATTLFPSLLARLAA